MNLMLKDTVDKIGNILNLNDSDKSVVAAIIGNLMLNLVDEVKTTPHFNLNGVTYNNLMSAPNIPQPTEEEVKQAIEKMKKRYYKCKVDYYYGYIVIADSLSEYNRKILRIKSGDVEGFFTVHDCLNK